MLGNMSFTASVLRVVIASPSDIPEARDAVEGALHNWNDANSISKHIVLLPWRWETASVPLLGGHPQAQINEQGVDSADIVIALFGSRLGSPTPEAVSGTVEEIERSVATGKLVHLYFSTAPLPRDIDTAQLDGLREFRHQISQRGLLGEFVNVAQLEHEVWKAIEFDVAKLDLNVSALATVSRGVKFSAQPHEERELKEYDKRGKARYTTRHWIEITNSGDKDATDVTFEVVGEHSSMMLTCDDEPTIIHAGQTRRLSVVHYLQGSDPDVIRIHWAENGEKKHKDFHVG
ncbi:hypothetical protein [Bifidobacterium aquikefiri]|uniref:Histidine kinase n=2 Tax=Bifidobacterium aquikefiri TaxID=1653207 RepID=A0A261GAC2_9BIFI|nr:hypothetical protein [Bifidobacterium aquikefiri]OZG68360.1 histidine kinase [Bifidobacterium aquikefiri]